MFLGLKVESGKADGWSHRLAGRVVRWRDCDVQDGNAALHAPAQAESGWLKIKS